MSIFYEHATVFTNETSRASFVCSGRNNKFSKLAKTCYICSLYCVRKSFGENASENYISRNKLTYIMQKVFVKVK